MKSATESIKNKENTTCERRKEGRDLTELAVDPLYVPIVNWPVHTINHSFDSNELISNAELPRVT